MVWADILFVQGIIIGIIAIAALCMAYSVYKRVTAKEREKIAPEIMHLTNELLK